MSFADYTSLKTALTTDWLHRADITSQADDFIDLFESDFNSTMRVRQMEASTSMPSTTGFLTHPTNWLGWKGISLTSGGLTYYLEPATDEIAVDRTYGEGTSATPRYYKVRGSRTYFYPGVSTTSPVTFNCYYWEGVSLSSSANWLLTSYPGAYLFGCLLAATASTGDDPRIPVWQSYYAKVIDAIKQDSRRSEWSGQVLTMKPERVV
jgi:hypothetical protein